MSKVIAGIYEIQEKIGSGGGGIVYLGKHIRLEKEIVLKTDKRELSIGTELLRREVDMLKGLNHMYIPQVYDFVQEDGVVYTIMDFIEGESLDKILDRGEHPSQPQVIQWACQLLKALSYLHSRPPYGILHGDIKPANIMRRRNGDICLIDYNIALALEEDGAVKIGFSQGYASPEHYGLEYKSSRSRAAAMRAVRNRTKIQKTNAKRVTALVQGDEKNSFNSGGSTTGGHRQITLDARSDIYSLGATLYHLVSGQHPADDALQVKPLGANICSSQVADIIKKAMEPDPDMRYQSAEEMLDAFRNLHKRDKRVIWHKRKAKISAACVVTLFLAGGASTFVGLKQMEHHQEALALAEYSSNSLAEGNISEAVRLALQALPNENDILEAPVTAQAQKALVDALGVYDLSDGFKALGIMEFPAPPFSISVSPEGSRFAVVYPYEAAIFNTETYHQIVTLPMEKSALSDVIFVDENIVVYAGIQGITAYDLEKKQEMWTGERATTLAVSGDMTVVAAVNRDEDHAIFYHMPDGEKIGKCSFQSQHMAVAVNDTFADPDRSVFALNEDGSLLAVSFEGGSLRLFDWKNPDEDLIMYEESDYTSFDGGFCGNYFAFSANDSAGSQFGLIDTKKAVYLGGHESQNPYLLKADERGIWLANGNLLVSFDPNTLEEKELAYTDQVNIINFFIGKDYVLTATDEPGFSFFDKGANRILWENTSEICDFAVLADQYAIIGNKNEPTLRLLKQEAHDKAFLLSYDAHYPHDEARISQDKKTAVLFSYQGFRVYSMEGNVLAEVELPDPEQVYDQQFRRNGTDSWLEVIWYNGMIRCYNAADGVLRSETAGSPPDKDLYEEFDTDQYHITSPLHGVPEVYNLKTGQKIGRLEEESYLTYVTQIGEYIMTEYIRAEGERYGLLLDKNLQTIAYLPKLCDIIDDTLVFDYKSGNLRQCHLYSLQELIELGENYIKEWKENERRE